METLRALQELDENKRAGFMYGLCRQNLNCGRYCGKERGTYLGNWLDLVRENHDLDMSEREGGLISLSI